MERPRDGSNAPPGVDLVPSFRTHGKAIRVVVADDHDLIRQAVGSILSQDGDIAVVGEASSGLQAIRMTTELEPDILLLDIQMPELDGLQVAERIAKLAPLVKVLVLSQVDSLEHLVKLLKLGACGYVLKDNAAHELIFAIHTVQHGMIYLTPRMTTNLVQHMSMSTEQQISRLTPRETEVLKLVAEGATGPQIAERLNLSVKTVQAHRTNIMEKLDLHSRVDLVRYAIKIGLASSD